MFAAPRRILMLCNYDTSDLFLLILQAPWRTRGRDMGALPPLLFLKSYFARVVFLEIRFCVILQGIQNILRPGTLKISSRVLY